MRCTVDRPGNARTIAPAGLPNQGRTNGGLRYSRCRHAAVRTLRLYSRYTIACGIIPNAALRDPLCLRRRRAGAGAARLAHHDALLRREPLHLDRHTVDHARRAGAGLLGGRQARGRARRPRAAPRAPRAALRADAGDRRAGASSRPASSTLISSRRSPRADLVAGRFRRVPRAALRAARRGLGDEPAAGRDRARPRRRRAAATPARAGCSS